MATEHARGGISPYKITLQVLITIAAIALWEFPLLQPVKLMVVLLHEMSHGLMALATGGAVEDIVITSNEGGSCHTTGGNALLIVSAGYLGSMFFGGIILSASRSRGTSAVAYALLAFLLFGAAFTVIQDAYSKKFALGVAAAAIFTGAFAPTFLSVFVLRAVGTISCLYAIVDIYTDILSKSAQNGLLSSDAIAFAELSGVAPLTIGAGWMLLSLFYFFITLKASLSDTRPEPMPPHRQAALARA